MPSVNSLSHAELCDYTAYVHVLTTVNRCLSIKQLTCQHRQQFCILKNYIRSEQAIHASCRN